MTIPPAPQPAEAAGGTRQVASIVVAAIAVLVLAFVTFDLLLTAAVWQVTGYVNLPPEPVADKILLISAGFTVPGVFAVGYVTSLIVRAQRRR